eukprot:UN30814
MRIGLSIFTTTPIPTPSISPHNSRKDSDNSIDSILDPPAAYEEPSFTPRSSARSSQLQIPLDTVDRLPDVPETNSNSGMSRQSSPSRSRKLELPKRNVVIEGLLSTDPRTKRPLPRAKSSTIQDAKRRRLRRLLDSVSVPTARRHSSRSTPKTTQPRVDHKRLSLLKLSTKKPGKSSYQIHVLVMIINVQKLVFVKLQVRQILRRTEEMGSVEMLIEHHNVLIMKSILHNLNGKEAQN